MQARQWIFLLALLSIPCGVFGEIPVSMPDGVYNDPDPAAVHFAIGPGRLAQFRNWLYGALATHPKDPVLLADRAYLFSESGDSALAMRDFDKAIAYAEPGSSVEANVYWSRGWARYDQGDYEGALDDWQHEISLHGGKPYWQAYTFALLQWSAGNQDAALAWFTAAVASDPRWGNDHGFEEKTRYWRPAQQEDMRRLFKLWLLSRSA